MIKKFHLYDWLEPLVYIFIIVYWSAQQILTNNGTYIDTDNYFHVLRTIDFMQNPSIFEHRFMWSNYPFGEISHWTKLPDILMSLLILPFLPFYPLKEAAFAGGLLFNPFLLINTFLVCWLGVKNLLNFRSRIAFFVILFAQIHFMQSFLADRPDHHSLLIFLQAVLPLSLYVRKRKYKRSQRLPLPDDKRTTCHTGQCNDPDFRSEPVRAAGR